MSRSQALGKSTLETEITNISNHGVWLYTHGRELFMSYEDFPWFKDVPVRKILNIVKNLPRYNRRYDFFTIEELLKIAKLLSKLNINLVENIHWKTCSENLVISKYPAKQYRTSISLTFLKK